MIHAEIRRRILLALKDFHSEFPAGAMPEEPLYTDTRHVSKRAFAPNLRYLLDAGYVERDLGRGGYVITAKGIDLIDAPSEFNRRFPDAGTALNAIVEDFLLSIREGLVGADMPAEEKESILAAVRDFASKPAIAPLVDNAVFKVLGIG